MMIEGSMVAIVTPFEDEGLDEEGLRELIEFQIENGTDAIIPCGTTGESATLSYEEHNRVIDITVDAVKGRVPVIAGTGSNNTSEAIRLTRHAKEAKADAVLMIAPYYNRPTQEGLYLHFKKVAEEVAIPIVLYNIASRTGVNMTPQTVSNLAKIDNIVGIKEASGSLGQVSEIINLCGDQFSVVSGDDILTLPILSVGGKGVISTVANIAPADVAGLYDAFKEGDLEKAKKLHHQLLPLIRGMFLETNPIPVKTALGLMGKISGKLRLPLSPMSESNLGKLKKIMEDYKLI
jgi:4-hydroxy-tetrahydrodipicolinate synthase